MTPRNEMAVGVFSEYPWLWAVTNRWFMGEDQVEVTTLTVPLLKRLTYSNITDSGGSSWFVFQRIRVSSLQVERVGTYSTPRGAPMARILRKYSGVKFVVELKWEGKGKQMHRKITLYDVPPSRRGPYGSSLKLLCAKALATGGDGLDDRKPYPQRELMR